MKMSKIIQAVVFFAMSAVSLAPATATAAITQSIKASEMSKMTDAVDGQASFALVADNGGLQTVHTEYDHLKDRVPGNPGVSAQSLNETVPEPEEWAMMLVGAGLVGFQVRRKQKLLSKTLWKRR